MKTTVLRSLACAGGLLIGTQFQTPVLAESPTITRTFKVDISDLDLSRPRDVRSMRHRIERAAREVCEPQSFAMAPEPKGYLGYDTCYRRAVEGALAQVKGTTLASGRQGRARAPLK